MVKRKISKFIKTEYNQSPLVSVMEIPLNLLRVEAAGVYRVIQIGNKKPYICISASRSEKSPEENKIANKKLLEAINENGLYAYDLIGMWKECPEDNPNCKEDEKTQVVEESFFIPYESKLMELDDFIEFFMELAAKFGQEEILVGLPSAYNYDFDELEIRPNVILKPGNHYGLRPTGADSYGTELKMETLKDYGSIAIDPKKNRMIEWVIGTLQPSSVIGRRRFQLKGLAWVHGMDQNTKASLSERNQNLLAKALNRLC